MFRTLRLTTFVTLAVLLVTSTLGLAANTAMSGTLQNVDAQRGRITLKSDEGKTVELQAPASLLTGLQAGDAVEVRMSGEQATSIHKQGGTSRPGMSETQITEPKTKPSTR